MSKYTTEVRFICEQKAGYDESLGYSSVDEIITKAIPKIFSFSFPMFDESYRQILERKILKHYYTREISEEAYGLWQLRLDTKLNEIMPYYNKLYESELLQFNPLYTVNLTRDRKTDFDSDRLGTENITDATTNANTTETENTKEYGQTKEGTNDGTVNANGQNTSDSTTTLDSDRTSSNSTTSQATSNKTDRDLYSDTPQGALQNVENETYLTNAKKVTSNGSDNGTVTGSGTESDDSTTTVHGTDVRVDAEASHGESSEHIDGTESDSGNVTTNGRVDYSRSRGDSDKFNSTEDYLEHVVGYEGANLSKMLKDYRDTFLNIDLMVIKELEPLFFQLW